VWVEDGHVFVEGHDGKILSMIPEVAIEMGRLVSQAVADSLIIKVLDRAAQAAEGRPLAE
jgi:hypothetical protein